MLAVLMLAGHLAGRAQPLATENPNKITAAFPASFLKHVEWPEDVFASPRVPIRPGVLGEDPLGALLETTRAGRGIGEHPFPIVRTRSLDAVTNCHIGFLPVSEEELWNDCHESIKGLHVPWVGEHETFLARSGMIRLLVRRDRVAFDVALNNAHAAGLDLRSRLLELANQVIAVDRLKET